MDIDQLVNKALSRRNFLAGAGAAAAATAMAGCASGVIQTPVTPPYGDTDILNFALNLEYLEAEYFLRAATGNGLQSSDISTPSGYYGNFTQGTVTATGAQAIPGLTTAQQDYINEIAYEEQQHVRLLRAALGSAAVPEPSIDLTFFGPLAMNAGITTVSTGTGAFNPWASFDTWLVAAFLFEDVGVTAYAGGAPLISRAGVAQGLLSAAAGILAVEAYHSGAVRQTLTARAIAAGSATAYPYLTYCNQIEALRATLTVGDTVAPGQIGSVETPLKLPTSTSTPSAIVAADPTNAIAPSRTVNQVHHIVYGSATVGVSKGGFFPNGTNSIFATTTA